MACPPDDAGLVHSWTPVRPDTVKQISAVCYITARDVKRAPGLLTQGVPGGPTGTLGTPCSRIQ